MNTAITPSADAAGANPVTPFPTALGDRPDARTAPHATAARDINAAVSRDAAPKSDAADAGATPDLLRRVTQGAHDVIDSLSAKAAAAQGKVGQVTGAGDEWISAARDVVRERPLLVIAGALLVGAGLNALLSSRGDR